MTAPGRAVAGLSTKSHPFHLPAGITWVFVKMLLQLFFEA